MTQLIFFSVLNKTKYLSFLKVRFSSITEIFVPNLIFIFIQGQIHMQYIYAIYECYFQFRNYIEFFVLFISFQKNWVQNFTGLEFASCCLLGFLFLFEKVQYTYYFRIHDVVSQDTYLVFTKFLWCKQISQRIYIYLLFLGYPMERLPNWPTCCMDYWRETPRTDLILILFSTTPSSGPQKPNPLQKPPWPHRLPPRRSVCRSQCHRQHQFQIHPRPKIRSHLQCLEPYHLLPLRQFVSILDKNLWI